MRAVKNDQYEYIHQVEKYYGKVAERIGDVMEKRYSLPDIVLIEDESDTRVLVLAPHQDDELLGCGGTINRLVRGGAKVTVAYMTDGRFGNLDHGPQEMIAIRENEAREGLRVLGVRDAVFNNDSDLCLECNDTTVGKLKETIRRTGANVIFVPHPRENHPDHWTTAQIAAHALKDHDGATTVLQYEVWTAFVPNALVDITDSMAIKVRALQEHQSQLSMLDYVQKISGLNSYRSINASGESKFCEAFVRTGVEEFVQIVEGEGL